MQRNRSKGEQESMEKTNKEKRERIGRKGSKEAKIKNKFLSDLRFDLLLEGTGMLAPVLTAVPLPTCLFVSSTSVHPASCLSSPPLLLSSFNSGGPQQMDPCAPIFSLYYWSNSVPPRPPPPPLAQ